MQLSVISTYKIFKDYKLHLPFGFVQSCFILKI